MSTTTSTLQLPVVPTGVKKVKCTTPEPQVTKGEFSKSLEPKRNDSVSRPSREGPSEGHIENFDLVDTSSIKRAGKFLLGPVRGSSPVKCIQQVLARKDGTDDFYILKILTLKDVGEKQTSDDIQGKTLLHTEHSLLSLVKNEQGVVHEHGMFRQTVQQKVVGEKGEVTVKGVRRLCLVLDCFVAHDFSRKFNNITNMQCHVIKETKLPESEAMRIFCKVVEIVERLHKLNIVHRDLKLGNIILDKVTRQVTLANFCLGKHLSSENALLKDQRGSPAYVSPEVISGRPFLGKPSDMWALGVVLYTMLFGQFPFYDKNPTQLFRKIKLGEFEIPVNVNVSQKAVELIQSLIVLNPKKRLTASQALEKVRSVITAELSLVSDSDVQVVPNYHPGAERPTKRTYSEEPRSPPTDIVDDIFAKWDESTDIKDLEPVKKKVKLELSPKQFNELTSKYTFDDQQLKRIRAKFAARKIAEALEAALLGEEDSETIAEQLAIEICSFSINGLIKSATTTDTDIARVPECSVGIANAPSTATSAVGLESKIE